MQLPTACSSEPHFQRRRERPIRMVSTFLADQHPPSLRRPFSSLGKASPVCLTPTPPFQCVEPQLSIHLLFPARILAVTRVTCATTASPAPRTTALKRAFLDSADNNSLRRRHIPRCTPSTCANCTTAIRGQRSSLTVTPNPLLSFMSILLYWTFRISHYLCILTMHSETGGTLRVESQPVTKKNFAMDATSGPSLPSANVG
jgi:hypothetical protein